MRTGWASRLGDTAGGEMLGFSAVVATLADWSVVRMDIH
jgi:hypothetical protein